MGMQQSTVETFIETALTARIAAAKTPGSNLKWTTAKMPWIRFTSNVLHLRSKGDIRYIRIWS